MNAVREFPANPHALVIHTDARLTDEIVETYVSDSSRAPDWVRRLLAIEGVRVVSLNTYKARVQKHKNAAWNQVLDHVEGILADGLAIGAIEDHVPASSDRRTFCWHHGPFTRRVFEGRSQAAKHPLAGRLFAIDGVAEVILDGNTVEIRRSPLFEWDELAASIESSLDPEAWR
ncbi:MAG: hypothetical protein GKS06_02710 [Acidobacteria bacterium]|nr:hypothetical protein [Acidobacteriota bacterium]